MTSPEGSHPSRKERIAARRAGRKEQETLSEQQISRRKFLQRLGLAFGGAAAAIGGGAWLWSQERNSALEPQRPKAMTIDGRSEEYEALSERLRAPYEALSIHLGRFEAALNEASLPDEVALILRQPIEIFKINQENPYKDFYQLQLFDLRQRGEKALTTEAPYNLGNGAYFSVSLKHVDDANAANLAAAFSTLERNLVIDEEFSSESMIDGLIGYHELVHAFQDAIQKSHLKSEADFALYSSFSRTTIDGKPVFNIAEEQDAFFRQILMFNVMTGGQFAKDCLDGKLDEETYSLQFGASSEGDQLAFRTMLSLGETLFRADIPGQLARKQMDDRITDLYARFGYIVQWRSIDELRQVMKTLPKVGN